MSYFRDEFCLNSTSGKEISKAILSEQNFILYFYPKDNTSGCSLEAQDFADFYDEFKTLGYEVYGISKDSIKSHEKFKEKFNLPFELIADEEKVLHDWFNVIKEKKCMESQLSAQSGQPCFKEGLLCLAEFRGVKVKGHAKAVLDHLQK